MPKLSVQGVNPYPSPSIPQQSAAGFLTIRRRLADPSHPTVSSDFFISSHRICSHPVAVTPRDGGPARERICLSQARMSSKMEADFEVVFYQYLYRQTVNLIPQPFLQDLTEEVLRSKW
ncbi:uncharacterized protein LOC110839142 isoform X1 [Zootermopsis nevadensis]|uniref:uncharacterized protein LOC110839142 isoform X1 n=1 Tax=Zootermopsis nevadensis TaxID=136037 RepID=UPI000B8EB07C|nr:uncharacterized protein LOC110839142 isoform X1 [Zootermopsis nevadensis]